VRVKELTFSFYHKDRDRRMFAWCVHFRRKKKSPNFTSRWGFGVDFHEENEAA
jgi:hypothetical protein